jgi:CheY-like chemotaxis protein
MILILFQTTINSSICPHFERPHSERWTATNPSTPNSERCNGDIYREDNTIIEEILSKPSASEDSKDDSSILEALKETIDLVDPFSQQLNIGDSIISVGSRRSSQQQLSNNGDRIISVGSRRSSKQQLSIKGDSIISTGCRKKVSIVATSNLGEIPPYNSRTSTQEELSTYNSRRSSIDSNRRSSSVVIKQNFDILIVDDSGLNRKMLCRLLRASGYVFDEAEDGLLALNKVKAKMSVAVNGFEKGSFGVILMDYIMPNMDGPTATKAIRDLGYTAPIFGK